MRTSELADLVFAPLLHDLPAKRAAGQFLVVPGKGTPRWLIPQRHQKVDSVLANWSPYLLSSRLKWTAIRTVHRAGYLSALPGVSGANIPGIEDINWRSLGWAGKVSPVLVVYVGTPCASRKAVIHLVDPVSGICNTIVKVPLTQGAKAAILREADVLATLADEGYNCAPRLLYVDREQGISTQTTINGKAGGRKFTDVYWAVLQALLLAGERTTIVGHAAEWRQQLSWASDCEADIGAVTAAMYELCDVASLPACWGHGDLAPWNTRQMPDGSVVLLDWEDAQRGALPLQDAFHFFHMQDYLFGARPATHSAQVERFASVIGISPAQCRKLEIAYLAHSYLQRRARHEIQHGEYLLETLRVALPVKHHLLSWPIDLALKTVPGPGKVTTLPHYSAIRRDLFAAVIAQLNSAEIPYCVLSGHDINHTNNSSDIDFMIYPRDRDRIAGLLAQAARCAGARLIQAMEHETTGCYFILAKEDGGEVGYLEPDCATDYRRQGRLWLSAANVLERSRRCKGIRVPAVPDEFTYYLIKKVLKQSLGGPQLRRLRHLYQRSPVTCRAEILRFWPPATVRVMERALIGDDLSWFHAHLPALLTELKASSPMESWGKRVVQRFRDVARVVQRVLHPTGMSVLLCGGEKARREAIAEGLLRQLAPAFRRTAQVQLPSQGAASLAPSLRLASRVLTERLRSTLVIAAVGDSRFITRASSVLAARVLFRPDLIFVLADEEEQTPTSDVDVNIQQMTRTILRWLAARQEKRLSLPSESPAECSAVRRAEGRPQPGGLHLVVK